jgi:2-keto-3-deoxy-L-rhamnonate aldolase RhmA
MPAPPKGGAGRRLSVSRPPQAATSSSRLFKCLAENRLALGSMLYAPGPEWAELTGHSGLDFFIADQMGASTDWSQLANLFRAGNQFGITPMVRLASFPWSTKAVTSTLAVDVYRAFGVGAEGVVASVNTAAEVAEMLEAADEAHHRHHLPATTSGRKFITPGFSDREPGVGKLVVPLIESVRGLESLDEMLSLPNLSTIMLGMGDLTRVMGCGRNDLAKEMTEVVILVCTKAAERGVRVLASQLAEDAETVAERARHYRGLGVSGLLLPHPFKIALWFYRQVIENVDAGR